MPKKKTQEAPQRRPRRGIEDRIAQLEAKIAVIKEREARKQAKADPALRHASAAIRAIDKALEVADDDRVKRLLNDARTTLDGLLGGGGGGRGNGRATRAASGNGIDADALLTYVRNNPDQRGEQIAAAMATDAGTIRPFMKRLIADGQISTKGQKRGMTYAAV